MALSIGFIFYHTFVVWPTISGFLFATQEIIVANDKNRTPASTKKHTNKTIAPLNMSTPEGHQTRVSFNETLPTDQPQSVTETYYVSKNQQLRILVALVRGLKQDDGEPLIDLSVSLKPTKRRRIKTTRERKTYARVLIL